MLGDLAGEPSVRSTFEEASAVLGYDLAQLVAVGPQDKLNTTEYTQPALLAAGVATFRLWRERGGEDPAVVSGHSLGEFTALVCACAFDFSAAVDLVRQRGQLMQQAVPAGTGGMAAILGLEDAQVAQACKEGSVAGVVEAVNFNAPGQVVIAGETVAVQKAIEAAKALGAKRAMALPVSVPSHSSLMRSAAERFGEKLAELDIRSPRITYISAVDGERHSDAADIRGLLVRQLASPVRWVDTVRALAAAGISQLIECGPGKVLTGLNRRIDRGGALQFSSLDDSGSLDAALSQTKKG
jgi:[acyl-carrier-protein] S-malonyltransferase